MAGDAGTVRPPDGDGQLRTVILEPTINVVMTDADDSALWCRPVGLPISALSSWAFAPWTPATVLK